MATASNGPEPAVHRPTPAGPRQGVAVHRRVQHAWGFGEKAAVALLAGMPSCKPATSTALSGSDVRILAATDVLPPGAVSSSAGRRAISSTWARRTQWPSRALGHGRDDSG